MKNEYFETIVLIERLHRLFLEVIKVDLDRMETRDINNVQALILYNIGTSQLTVGELTNRGYYLGSNVSYNLRKMVQNGYVDQVPSPHDRRSSHVKLSEKGLMLYKRLDDVLSKQASQLSENTASHMDKLCHTLKTLEQYWMGLVSR